MATLLRARFITCLVVAMVCDSVHAAYLGNLGKRSPSASGGSPDPPRDQGLATVRSVKDRRAYDGFDHESFDDYDYYAPHGRHQGFHYADDRKRSFNRHDEFRPLGEWRRHHWPRLTNDGDDEHDLKVLLDREEEKAEDAAAGRLGHHGDDDGHRIERDEVKRMHVGGALTSVRLHDKAAAAHSPSSPQHQPHADADAETHHHGDFDSVAPEHHYHEPAETEIDRKPSARAASDQATLELTGSRPPPAAGRRNGTDGGVGGGGVVRLWDFAGGLQEALAFLSRGTGGSGHAEADEQTRGSSYFVLNLVYPNEQPAGDETLQNHGRDVNGVGTADAVSAPAASELRKSAWARGVPPAHDELHHDAVDDGRTDDKGDKDDEILDHADADDDHAYDPDYGSGHHGSDDAREHHDGTGRHHTSRTSYHKTVVKRDASAEQKQLRRLSSWFRRLAKASKSRENLADRLHPGFVTAAPPTTAAAAPSQAHAALRTASDSLSNQTDSQRYWPTLRFAERAGESRQEANRSSLRRHSDSKASHLLIALATLLGKEQALANLSAYGGNVSTTAADNADPRILVPPAHRERGSGSKELRWHSVLSKASLGGQHGVNQSATGVNSTSLVPDRALLNVTYVRHFVTSFLPTTSERISPSIANNASHRSADAELVSARPSSRDRAYYRLAEQDRRSEDIGRQAACMFSNSRDTTECLRAAAGSGRRRVLTRKRLLHGKGGRHPEYSTVNHETVEEMLRGAVRAEEFDAITADEIAARSLDEKEATTPESEKTNLPEDGGSDARRRPLYDFLLTGVP